MRADPEKILSDRNLSSTALSAGKQVYLARCASCHGEHGAADPARGVPDLTDKDHLYGDGKVAEIEAIARYGIRAHDRRGWDLASMPAYASQRPYKVEPLPPQNPTQIEDITQYLMWFTGRQTNTAAALRGRSQYQTAGCWDCHGRDAGGDPAIGAPTLSDSIWLYGGTHADIYRSISRGRAGFSPAFSRALSAAQLRDVSVYVASLDHSGDWSGGK